MRRRRVTALLLTWVAVVVSALPGNVPPARAAEYTLESIARYDVRPAERQVGVSVDLTFTNTTPDPEGFFSVFSEIQVAIHDQATEVTASDDEGELEVDVAVENDVNVATIALREDLRFEEDATFELAYVLPDTEDARLRVRSSVVVFPAWSFGTSGEVQVTIPSGFEVRVDGDPLTEEGGELVSGTVENPNEWLALVTAVRPGGFAQLEATVPLEGGTADLLVRSFEDDEAWGERTIALVEEALPLIEAAVGLPYPRLGQLILTEAVPSDGSGFAEGSPAGEEIMVAFDQPPFTILHQVAHVWLSNSLIDARWIREGLASHVAAHVAEQLEVDPPYDPAAEAEARAEVAFALDTWSSSGGIDEEFYGYAASWALVDEIESVAGADTLATVLARVAASVGPYQSVEIEPEPQTDGSAPAAPLTTRAFLDHLETVSKVDLAPLFAERVLAEEDVALLPERSEARDAFDDLVATAGSWGAPDPVRGAMVSWNFDDAVSQIESARSWLEGRDDLLARMEEAGLSPPDRLQQAYRAYGGGSEAARELDAERAVVDEYAKAAGEVNEERSFVERIGLVGGPDPQAQLTVAAARFGDGDLRGSLEAISEAQRIVAAAESGGFVRLASAALLVLVLGVAAVILFRRRASYTAAP